MISVAQDEGRQRVSSLAFCLVIFLREANHGPMQDVSLPLGAAPDSERKVAWAGSKCSPGGWLADHQQLWTRWLKERRNQTG
jgi:hypothetical protein